MNLNEQQFRDATIRDLMNNPEAVKLLLDTLKEKETLPDFSYYHQVALENNGSFNHPYIRSFVDERFKDQDIVLHLDPSAKFGFVCLASDKKVCKEKDLKKMEEMVKFYEETVDCPDGIAIHNLKRQLVPNGTIGVFVAMEDFDVLFKECDDLEDGVFIHRSCQFHDGNSISTANTSRVTAISWNSQGKVLAAGLYLKLALLEDPDSLLDLEHQNEIDALLENAEWINKEVMEEIEEESFSVAALPHSFLPTTTNLQVNPFLLPPSSFIPPVRVVYSTKCPATYCPQFAWIRDDGKIEIHTFDRFGTPQWSLTKCQECLLQIQRAVRWLKHENPFVMGDLPEIYKAPPTSQITGYNFHPTDQINENILVCAHIAPGALEHYFLIMRNDGQLGMYTLCVQTRHWSAKVPEDVFEKLLENARSRGINNNVCCSEVKTFVETVNNGYHTSLSTENFCQEWRTHLEAHQAVDSAKERQTHQEKLSKVHQPRHRDIETPPYEPFSGHLEKAKAQVKTPEYLTYSDVVEGRIFSDNGPDAEDDDPSSEYAGAVVEALTYVAPDLQDPASVVKKLMTAAKRLRAELPRDHQMPQVSEEDMARREKELLSVLPPAVAEKLITASKKERERLQRAKSPAASASAPTLQKLGAIFRPVCENEVPLKQVFGNLTTTENPYKPLRQDQDQLGTSGSFASTTGIDPLQQYKEYLQKTQALTTIVNEMRNLNQKIDQQTAENDKKVGTFSYPQTTFSYPTDPLQLYKEYLQKTQAYINTANEIRNQNHNMDQQMAGNVEKEVAAPQPTSSFPTTEERRAELERKKQKLAEMRLARGKSRLNNDMPKLNKEMTMSQLNEALGKTSLDEMGAGSSTAADRQKNEEEELD